MKNPDYKGPWKAPSIPNPEYQPNPELYRFSDLKFLGFELWQVRAALGVKKMRAHVGKMGCALFP